MAALTIPAIGIGGHSTWLGSARVIKSILCVRDKPSRRTSTVLWVVAKH